VAVGRRENDRLGEILGGAHPPYREPRAGPGEVRVGGQSRTCGGSWENNTRGLRGDRTWVFHASDDDGVLAYDVMET
jgi:hypothetical protein